MAVAIREAGRQDVPVLTGIIRESFSTVACRLGLTRENCPKHPSNCTDEWVAGAIAEGVAYWLLEEDGMPVGCVALEDAGEGVGYLERLAVLPACRHQGHGRRLVAQVFAEAAPRSIARISIGIIAEERVLREWYESLGFEEAETKVFDHLPFDVLFMSAAVPGSADAG